MLLSIIIVSYNCKEYLKRCIDSIPRDNRDLEIVVVDNNSSDNSAELLKKTYPFVKLIENKENVGFGHANNIGFRHSLGDFVLLLNADAALLPDALQKTVSAYTALKESNGCDGILGMGLKGDDGVRELSFGDLPGFFSIGPVATIMWHLKKMLGRSYKEEKACSKKVGWLTGAYMFLPRTLYLELGGFDENIFLYFEDVELCKRVWDLGYQVWFNDQIAAIHSRGKSKSSYRRGKLRRKALLYYLRKHSSLSLFPLKIYYYILSGIDKII